MAPHDRTLVLGAAERDRLVAGARPFGVALDARAVDRFVAYAELLGRWSARTNLISCRSAGELVGRHLLDSLALSPHLGAARTIVDLGSGAGLPGLPLAIANPTRRIILVESRRRRASFLREVKRTLDLENVDVLELRAAAGVSLPSHAGATNPPIHADVVVCRAVWADDDVLPIAAAWLRPDGILLWMRAGLKRGVRREAGRVDAKTPTTERASGMVENSSVEYAVETGPRRRIEIFRRATSA